MQDSEVVAAIVAGDPDGLAEAYDRYAAALYGFCKAMLREPADAADAVQDTFVIAAARLSGLRNPERLRPWLYAVARNECRRRLRSGSQQAPIEAAQDVTDEAADVAAGAEKAELRALVRGALAGLGSAEREVLELQLRQGLGGGEVASVLGISRSHAHALLSRARGQLETALGVLVVARSGRQDCPALDMLLKDWDDRLTVLLRKRVNRHMERCQVCSGRQRREMTPAMLLGAVPIAALPLAAFPAGHKSQVLRAAIGNSPAAAAHGAAARTMNTFGHHGFPRPLDPPRTRWPRPAHARALAGTTAALALGVTIVAVPPRHGAPPAGGRTTGVTGGASPAASRTATRTADSAAQVNATSDGHSAPATAPTAPPSASPSPSPSPSASPSPSPTASPSASAITSTAPVPGTLSVSPTTLDVTPPAVATITLTASGGPVNWSVSEPPGLTKKVVVSPRSGTLAADATTTVSVSVDGPGKMHVHLVFSPGGTTVTVVVG